MKKWKLIALAIAATVTAPVAMAQSSNPVTVYGGLRVAFESIKANGGVTEVAGRNRVSNQLSYFGLRGAEQINSDLSAFFQIESGVAVDTGDSRIASRNSAVGLRGNWGSVLLGRWDTPYKVATNGVDPFDTLQLTGMTALMNDAGNFDQWSNNMIQYWSPTVAGFKVRAHYSANEEKNNTASPALYSASAVYEQGPVYVGYAYEEHKNRTGSNVVIPLAGYIEKSNAIFAKVEFGPFWVSALAQDVKKTDLTKQKAYMLAANYAIGASQFKLSVQDSKDGGVPGAAAPRSRAYGIGWYYSLSPRTTMTTSYMQARNNAATNRANFGQHKLAIGNGADPRGLSVGINHTF